MMNEKAKLIERQQVFTTINFFMVGVMMTGFAFILGEFIRTLYPGLDLTYFPALAFVVTLEALILRHIRHSSYDSFQNLILTTLVEFILIVLALKAFSVVTSGFSSIWLEVKSWQDRFLPSFFDVDYMLLTLAVLFIWIIACIFSQSLNQLDEDETAMDQEKLGHAFKDRQEERRGLIRLVFIIGFVMIAFMVLMKSNLDLLPDLTMPKRSYIFILLVYFAASFVLLALNQYIIMKARWYLDDIVVHPSLAKRWLVYTLSFILLVILVIGFLPTKFAIGFYPIAQAIFQVLLFTFGFIQFLITLPVALVISLINSLFSSSSFEEQMTAHIPEYIPPVTEISNTMPWMEVVKSIFFWAIFLGVTVFSIRYYMTNKEAFKLFLNSIQVGKWLQDAWRWLSQSLMKMRRITAEVWQQSIQKVQTFIQNRRINLPALAGIAQHLPPRQAVILTYIDWIRWSHSHGISRDKSQTPLEFARLYQEIIPEANQEIQNITNSFLLARYTRETIIKQQAQLAREALSSLKEILNSKQSGKATNP